MRLRFNVLSIDYVRVTNCFYDYDYILKLKCTKFDFGWGSGFKVAYTSKGREGTVGEGEKGRTREGRRRGRKGEGREGREKGAKG